MWGLSPRAGMPLLLLLAPPLLIALQLLALGSRLPAGARSWWGAAAGGPRDRAVVSSVISIDPHPRGARGARSHPPPRPGALEEMREKMRDAARAYEDENEWQERQMGPRALEVQLWASDKPSFTAELSRIIAYIARPQLNCSRVYSPGQAHAIQPPAASAHWLLCAENWLLPASDRPCVAYSFRMDGGDADFLRTVSRLGCEVHSFDPSNSNASGGSPGNSLASNHSDEVGVSQHKMWLDWRTRKRRRHKTRGNLVSASQTLADIMAALGHHTVHFLYADLLSAEWRVFQNWIEAGTLQNVHHLVATIHLQWAGFEVGGNSEEVLRYWFSVLRGLQASGLKLVHSYAGEGHSVLKQTVTDAHSSYTLTWVNTRH
ncbi:probable methyltransferase-like protein 24 [Cololabis saira]|uniref:probable methyltransferase-like protein 24 n=1 Tax=Cololabis saira TaxID=129043 RepID=UPI002AD4CD4C|nr:probable methyltransferase-like protein 24 [Cololabis saira]